ncbi:MAG: diaminopimelate epimerase [Deltaproteobacteria bacterium]|nr:diaminopimelate epimerase [Deltaproteobacteria bacterium]
MQAFSKYEGLGNDFLVVDRRESGLDVTADESRAWCDRRRGVGGDGVLALLPSPRAFARMVVHNADGSVAEMCGNGLRCAVKYLLDGVAGAPDRVAVETGAGVLECEARREAGRVVEVEVAMGPARLVAANLPSGDTGQPFVRAEVPGHAGVHGTAVNLGNPHLVLWNVPASRAAELGPVLEHHPAFRERTNVEFVARLGEGLDVTVWERGCGLTLACGTGACVAAVDAVLAGELPAGTWLPVRLPGGPLSIRVAADLSGVWMRGPVRHVFEGVL